MQTYRYFLCTFIFWDAIFNVTVGFFILPVPLFPSYGIIACGFAEDLQQIFGPNVVRVFICAAFWCGADLIQLQDFCLVYRFTALHPNKNLRKWFMSWPSMLVFHVIGFAICFATCIPIWYTVIDEADEAAYMAHYDPSIFKAIQPGDVTTFFKVASPIWTYYCPAVLIGFGLHFILSATISISIIRFLSQNAHAFSVKVYRLHKQLTIVLILQIFTPLIFMIIPISILVMYTLYLKIPVNATAAHFGILLLTVYPSTNTIITIICVTPYRRFTTNWIRALVTVPPIVKQDIQASVSPFNAFSTVENHCPSVCIHWIVAMALNRKRLEAQGRGEMVVNVFFSAVTSATMSRHELLAWINESLQANFTKIEEMATGAGYCGLTDCLFPGQINLKKVKWNSRNDVDWLNNWQVLQQAWKKLGVDKPVPVNALMKGKFQDNLEFLQWFKKFFDANWEDHEYNALEARGGADLPSLAPVGGARTARAPAPRPAPTRPAPARPTTAAAPPARRVAAAPATAAPAASTRPARTSNIGTTRAAPSAAESAQIAALTKAKAELEAQVAELVNEKAELTQIAEELTNERDFYYNKLREVEVVCTEVGEDASIPARQITEIIFRTDDGFEAVGEPEGEEHDIQPQGDIIPAEEEEAPVEANGTAASEVDENSPVKEALAAPISPIEPTETPTKSVPAVTDAQVVEKVDHELQDALKHQVNLDDTDTF
uniref:G protein-coupled receptor n=1 Tax=Panagrellus redivivus TaxID=6233 RepID=A0A7E4ZX22_PANRE